MPRTKAGGSENTAGPAPEIPLRPDAARTREVEISRIAPNPRNLREDDLWESEAERIETVTSIQEVGLIQALVVCTKKAHLAEYPDDAEDPTLRDADFIVMAGHRRLAACWEAGKTKVRIDVQDHQVKNLDLLMLEENLKRKALSVFQEGEGYRRLEAKGASHSQIAKRVAKGKSTITKRIALLSLPADAKQAILGKQLGVDAAYNLLVALDGQPDKVLAASEIMRDQRVGAQDAVNLLLTAAVSTDTESDTPKPVLTEPAAPVAVPASRAPEPPSEPASQSDPPTTSGTEPVLPEPIPTGSAGQAEAPAPAATKTEAPEQDGRAQANAARNHHCQHLVATYDKPATDPRTTRVAVTVLLHAPDAALTRAHGWLKAADLADAAVMAPASYRDALLMRGDATLIARLAYAVSLAEDELRASNRTRHWDYRDIAYLTHLIEGGYEPAESERRHLG